MKTAIINSSYNISNRLQSQSLMMLCFHSVYRPMSQLRDDNQDNSVKAITVRRVKLQVHSRCLCLLQHCTVGP